MPAHLGEVEIDLDGKKETLRCTLRAARSVSNLTGGFLGALQGIQTLNLLVCSQIIAAGLDVQDRDKLEKLEESVYASGLRNLASPLSTYVELLSNGGKKPSEVTKVAEGGKG